MYHGLHCVADSSWPINFGRNRCVGLLGNALPTSDVFSSLTLAETLLLPLHHKGPTGTGAVEGDLQGQEGGTAAQQKYFYFRKKISWERGHQLALKSVLNTPFLLGTLRMDPNEVLWEEPNFGPPLLMLFHQMTYTLLHTPPDQHKECRSPAGLIC